MSDPKANKSASSSKSTGLRLPGIRLPLFKGRDDSKKGKQAVKDNNDKATAAPNNGTTENASTDNHQDGEADNDNEEFSFEDMLAQGGRAEEEVDIKVVLKEGPPEDKN
ncbi:hypothetical protein DM02DRAFT_426434 [Periconia macrospinosa]|uniref:Uncharacterized protein n=1 Tax=Periconia macrospinosa TaxID=97972 RepID=A0A2V1E7M0_9PLEO|nr:hypothetical protein DM02DRAFT_426434 [Periconia macrospinosa]